MSLAENDPGESEESLIELPEPISFPAPDLAALVDCDDFSAGVLANARCGGDTCHRAAVVGSLLAAVNDIPEPWLQNLRSS